MRGWFKRKLSALTGSVWARAENYPRHCSCSSPAADMLGVPGDKQSVFERLLQVENWYRSNCWQEIPSLIMVTSLAFPDSVLLRCCLLWGVRSFTVFSYWEN